MELGDRLGCAKQPSKRELAQHGGWFGLWRFVVVAG